jgi:undecaprenyl diphosphate synthase
MSGLPATLQNILKKIVNETKILYEFNLTVTLNFSACNEVFQAINSIISHRNRDCTKKVTRDDFKNFLYTCKSPDPNLIIRTSGEQHLRNFQLLQSAYSEPFFYEKILAQLR